jgi:predicted dehydrogenase
LRFAAVAAAAAKRNATVSIAYNRRFYSSVRMARDIIAADGGATSCHFDFTEWSHQVAALDRAPEQKRRWLLANSSHVIDTAFHLIGGPAEITTLVAGSLEWHPTAAVFTGTGRSERGTLFSYHADWTGPGRWSCEVVTREHKLVFMPMEELRVMKRGSVAVEKQDPPDDIDARFKPGVYRQAEAFLAGKRDALCDIREHLAWWPVYERIAGYSEAESGR